MSAATAPRYPCRALQEARAAVLGQLGRSIVAMIGLGVAVALFLAVQSLVATVRFQVSDSFDAYAATTVHAALNDVDPTAPTSIDEDVLPRVRTLPGVRAATRYVDLSTTAPPVSTSRAPGTGVPGRLPIYAGDADFLRALDARTSGGTFSSADPALPVAMVGRRLADQMALRPEELGTRVLLLGSTPVTVIGVVEEAPRLRAAERAIILPLGGPVLPSQTHDATALMVTTRPGATSAIAQVLAVTAYSYHPDALEVSRVGETSGVRGDVDQLLVQLGWGASGLAGLVGAIVIVAYSAGSVSARAGEIGLRRSLGARRRDVVAQFFLESVLIGTFSGLLGVVIGTVGLLVMSGMNGWVPVVDPVALGAAPAAAVLISAVAGGVPALRASRVDPALALRR